MCRLCDHTKYYSQLERLDDVSFPVVRFSESGALMVHLKIASARRPIDENGLSFSLNCIVFCFGVFFFFSFVFFGVCSLASGDLK